MVYIFVGVIDQSDITTSLARVLCTYLIRFVVIAVDTGMCRLLGLLCEYCHTHPVLRLKHRHLRAISRFP